MASALKQDAADSFDPLRPKLIRIAYRMLGSVVEAEDVVQDAFLRWLDADRSDVREPEAYLRRVVMRLCLDVLKSARRQRETYIGPWLPEPIVEPEADALDDDVTLPLMLALERCRPWNAPPFCSTTSSAWASTRLPKRSAAMRRPAASSQAAPVPMFVPSGHVSIFQRSAASRSPRPSLRHPAAAT